ncbi:MAG: methylenetetrahydrofolate dehydrogenase [Chromatiales bacterium]|nr:methylenetetrahydrofolate dehydrogenase [Chromatiales bacterium]
MKKILIYLDTDKVASAFDAIVAYDAGVDNVISYADINVNNCASIVEGAIYTRPPKHKRNTAIMIGGHDLDAGEALKQAIQAQFFSGFRVSIMLDSCGCNTTAAAGIALLTAHHTLSGKTATVLAGTGPVGQRAAILLAQAGAKQVRLTSRKRVRAEQACALAEKEYHVELQPYECSDSESIDAALDDAQIVFCAGKTGVQLLNGEQWNNHRTLEALVDVNTQPPLGIEGIQMTDLNVRYHNRHAVFGGLAVGALKLKLQRACIAALFEHNELVLDAEQIYQRATALLK